jgi:hypothetical protein
MKKLILLLLFSALSFAQVNVALMPVPHIQFLDSSGRPLAGGKLYTYQAGTNLQQASYSDSTGTVLNSNPVVLDAGGFANVWLDTTKSYKFVLQNALSSQQWTVDNVPGGSILLLANTFAQLQTFAAGISFTEQVAPAGIAGADVVWGDSGTHRLSMNNNNGGTDQVVGAATTDTLTNKTYSGGNATFDSINGIQMADHFTGATADVQIAAAIAALPSTGGIVDARGYGATQQTIAAQLAIGTATKPVTLLLSPQTQFAVTVTGGVCAIPIADGSGITAGAVNNVYNPLLPSAQKAVFALGAAANVSAVFCAGNPGGQQTIYLNGVAALGNATATVGTALFDLMGLAAGSKIENSATATCYATGVEIRPGSTNNITSDVLFVNNNFACGGTAGSTPLIIDSVSNSKLVANIIFIATHFQNQGSAQSLVTMNGRGASGPGTGVYGVHFYGCDFEVSASSADAVVITDARNVDFDSFDVPGAVGTAVNALRFTETSSNLTHDIEIRHAAIAAAGGFTHLIRDGIGSLNIDGQTISNVFSVADYCFRCVKYNGNATLAAVVASGTSTLGNTLIGAGACATTVTTAATGALTTDAIEWAFATAPTTADATLNYTWYPTANNVNWKVCNTSAGGITPTAMVINWKVIR